MTPGRPSAVSGRRRFLRAARLGGGLALALFVLLLTYGRLSLLPREVLGGFYDAQAHALVEGHLDVDPGSVGFEGFRIGDETHIYQGLVPALARLPVVALTDRYDGRLTRLSMLFAFGTALWFVTRLNWRVRSLLVGSAPLGHRELWWAGTTTFAVGASSLLFLASKAWVYHEALLWGAAFALGAFDHLVAYLTLTHAADADADDDADAGCGPGADGDSEGDNGEATVKTEPMAAAEPAWRRHAVRRHAALAGLFSILAFNTRATVGAGPLAAIALAAALLGVRAVLNRHQGASETVARNSALLEGSGAGRLARASGWAPATTAGLGVLAASVVVAAGSYALVNHARFGSAFGLPLDKQVLAGFDLNRQEALAANANSLFGVKYAPSVALQALRPDAIGTRPVFPYLRLPDWRPNVIGSAVFDELDWSSSLPASEPLLFGFALAGLVVLILVRPTGPGMRVRRLRVPVAGALVGAAGFLLIGYIANRYLTDILPLLVLLALLGTHFVYGRWVAGARPGAGRSAALALAALAMWGAWANTALALQYQREIAPGAPDGSRAAWLDWQVRLGPAPGFTRIDVLAPLPETDTVGDLVVVGDCEGLYRSDGSIFLFVEGTAGVGRFDLEVTLGDVPDRPVPVVTGRSKEGRNDLLLEPAGPGQLRFVVAVTRNGEVVRSLPGQPFRATAGQRFRWRILVDWRHRFAQVGEAPAEADRLDVFVPLVPARLHSSDLGFRKVSDHRRSLGACERLTR